MYKFGKLVKQKFIIVVVSEYVEVMGSKVKPLLETKKELTDDEMEKYSKKDPEAYPLEH